MDNAISRPAIYSVISYEDKYYLINGDHLRTQSIDEETAEHLLSIAKVTVEDLCPNDHLFLHRLKLLNSIEGSIWKCPKSLTPITHLTLFVTQNCNLRCGYCYGEHGKYGNQSEMSHETAISAVDFLFQQSVGRSDLGISFFGGEPLLNLPLIEKVVDYASGLAKKEEKHIEYGLTTNGTLLSQKIISFLKKHGIVPVVSIDGPKQIHNMHRVFPNGAGTYDRIRENVKCLLTAIPNSICRATVVDSSLHDEIESHLKDIGFKYIQLAIASPSLFASTSHVDRSLTGIRDSIASTAMEIYQAITHKDIAFLKGARYSGLGWHLIRMMEQFITCQKRYFTCGAGKSGVAVSTDGTAYLCHRLVGQPDYALGSIRGSSLKREIYQESPSNTYVKCKTCYAKYLCAGGCFHDNLSTTGSISNPAPDMCSFMRDLTSFAAIVSAKLNDGDREFLADTGIVDRRRSPLDIF